MKPETIDIPSFIAASQVGLADEIISFVAIAEFITKANTRLKKGVEHHDSKVYLNSTLDKMPILSARELVYVTSKAAEAGWKLTALEDNHDSVTYAFQKILTLP